MECQAIPPTTAEEGHPLVTYVGHCVSRQILGKKCLFVDLLCLDGSNLSSHQKGGKEEENTTLGRSYHIEENLEGGKNNPMEDGKNPSGVCNSTSAIQGTPTTTSVFSSSHLRTLHVAGHATRETPLRISDIFSQSSQQGININATSSLHQAQQQDPFRLSVYFAFNPKKSLDKEEFTQLCFALDPTQNNKPQEENEKKEEENAVTTGYNQNQPFFVKPRIGDVFQVTGYFTQRRPRPTCSSIGVVAADTRTTTSSFSAALGENVERTDHLPHHWKKEEGDESQEKEQQEKLEAAGRKSKIPPIRDFNGVKVKLLQRGEIAKPGDFADIGWRYVPSKERKKKEIKKENEEGEEERGETGIPTLSDGHHCCHNSCSRKTKRQRKMEEDDDLDEANGDNRSYQPSKRARFQIFADFVRRVFCNHNHHSSSSGSRSRTKEGNSSSNIVRVLDIAGGGGKLSMSLTCCSSSSSPSLHHLLLCCRSIIIDPRNQTKFQTIVSHLNHDHDNVVVKKKSSEKGEKIRHDNDDDDDVDGKGNLSLCFCPICAEEEKRHHQTQETETGNMKVGETEKERKQEHQVEGGGPSQLLVPLSPIFVIPDFFSVIKHQHWIQHHCDVILGLHCDGAVNEIVNAACQYQKSFAICACCVFPRHFERWLDPIGGTTTTTICAGRVNNKSDGGKEIKRKNQEQNDMSNNDDGENIPVEGHRISSPFYSAEGEGKSNIVMVDPTTARQLVITRDQLNDWIVQECIKRNYPGTVSRERLPFDGANEVIYGVVSYTVEEEHL